MKEPQISEDAEQTAAAQTQQVVAGWDGEEDPLNPLNWSPGYKWCHILLVSLLTFVISLSSSMLAPAIPQAAHDLKTPTASVESFILSAYVIGYSLGPLLVAPLSELYGRSLVYQVSSLLFAAFSVGCALSTNVGMFIAFRLLSGCAGVTPLALGASSVGDVMREDQMGKPMALWGLASLLAPVLAPVAGGYLTEAASWRWIFWVIVIAMGVLIFASPFLLRETYAPVILERKAARMRKSLNVSEQQSSMHASVATSKVAVVRSAFLRPFTMFFSSPIVLILSIYVACVYAYQYLMFSTLASIYQALYKLSAGKLGLIYLGTGIGTILAVGFIGPMSDKLAARNKQNGKDTTPEQILWPQLMGAILVPAGLFWYGWTLEAESHPVVPLVGLGVFGFGMMAVLMPVQMYLVQAYGVHSASALAATNTLRNIAGALLPLGGPELYQTLGYGWGNSLLAFISIAMIPMPAVLMRFGGKLRARDRNIIQR
ncbi:MFS general substrate transporter [Curvularia clavata]|uniref:MFS general substrate transporter n=1 Tax=Curvularia clavata TaxID=95742 RepID=A0A9Q8ZIL1_CURCL|nr:MFS general substrate transporter [Curvularia clavata]